MPERITVNGYDVEGGVVTYNISVGDTLTLTKRFRECVALSDALKKADPSVAALPNPLHHNLRSTEKLAKTRVESLQEFLAALPLASLASEDWATFLASPPSDDPASPDKGGATLPDPDAPPATPAGKAPSGRTRRPSRSTTRATTTASAQRAPLHGGGRPGASAAAVASALADAAVEEAPAAEAPPPPPAVAVASAADLAKPRRNRRWRRSRAAVGLRLLDRPRRRLRRALRLHAVGLRPGVAQARGFGAAGRRGRRRVGPAGGGGGARRRRADVVQKLPYATYLEAPHKELKAAALAAATAGVALRGRQGA
ncbi:hypothetical protein SO694_00008329 [Aureococcus anophagefferens]|uniref:PX domain-containing protein n=1 Tax=Aureococcus anophagefferens TaxID=44056 RepID=A0ABR1GDP6_AURAN